MAEFQNFRSAFNGFNREDVVHYIEYINNKHTSQLNQLKTEMQTMQQELDGLRSAPSQDEGLAEKLAQSQETCAALEAELAALRAQLELAESKPQTTEELEAYRRAERAERAANERVHQLYAQANGALADATVKVDEAAAQIGDMVDRVTAQLSELQVAVLSGKATMRNAAAAMYAVRPVPSEE